MKIGLVIPVLNNFDQAIDLVYSAKSKNNLKIYIQPQYRYQVPLAAAWNRGIQEAIADGCEVIIVSNDDVIFPPYSIDKLAFETSIMEDKFVMAHPVDLFDVVDDPADILFFDENTYMVANNVEDQSYSCFAVRSDFFDKCGKFDENFDPAWWEDTDMKYRIHLLGYKTLQTDIPFVHLRHQSTKKLTLPLNSIKSGEYYIKKWGSAKKDLREAYANPYNDISLSPKDWRKQ
jgi:GT2 family glycosyltransferase